MEFLGLGYERPKRASISTMTSAECGRRLYGLVPYGRRAITAAELAAARRDGWPKITCALAERRVTLQAFEGEQSAVEGV